MLSYSENQKVTQPKMNISPIAFKLTKLARIEFLIPLMLCLSFMIPAFGSPKEFKHYVNSKYSYEIDYPSALINQAKDKIALDDQEQKFVSKDKTVDLTISFFPQNSNEKMTFESKWNEAFAQRKKDGDTINSIHKNAKTFAISGKLAAFQKNRIYFKKVITDKSGFVQFLLNYPAERKEELKPIIDRMVSSFKLTSDNSNQ